MATVKTLSVRLAESEAAYHELSIGKSPVEFRDQNGESLTYQRAQLPRLAAYVASLRRAVAGETVQKNRTSFPTKGL